MDWELIAQWSLSIVSGGGFAGGVAYLLIKQIVDNKLRQELEDYKSGLSRQCERISTAIYAYLIYFG